MALSWLTRAAVLWRWRSQQESLKAQLVELDDFEWSPRPGPSEGDAAPSKRLRRVGGLDISFFGEENGSDDSRACVAFVVCEFDEAMENFSLIWKDFEFVSITEPYIPGFLAFREAPHYCRILGKLLKSRPELMPDVVIVDGNGILHPRGFGVASHVGVLSGLCTVGMAKNLHIIDGLDRAKIREQCGASTSSSVPLVGESGRVWGAALLPAPRAVKRYEKTAINPVFVSVGHRVSLETCVEVVRLCLLTSRVPEPVRLADLLSREQVRLAKESEALVLSRESGRGRLFPAMGAVAILVLVGTFAGLRRRWK